VALVARFAHDPKALFDLAIHGAAVAGRRVPVVAFLALLDLAVAAEGNLAAQRAYDLFRNLLPDQSSVADLARGIVAPTP
jgi:hypothetical protein